MTNLQALTTPEVTKAPEAQRKEAHFDVMALVYMLLLDAVTTSTETAQVRAKGLQSNAAQQVSLNKREAAKQFGSVPADHVHHEKKHYTGVEPNAWNWPTKVTWTVKKTWTTGQFAMYQAENKNNEISGERQELSQRMVVLEQNASAQEGEINSISGIVTQEIQESSMLLTILTQMTYKALLRQPVQG